MQLSQYLFDDVCLFDTGQPLRQTAKAAVWLISNSHWSSRPPNAFIFSGEYAERSFSSAISSFDFKTPISLSVNPSERYSQPGLATQEIATAARYAIRFLHEVASADASSANRYDAVSPISGPFFGEVCSETGIRSGGEDRSEFRASLTPRGLSNRLHEAKRRIAVGRPHLSDLAEFELNEDN